MHDIVRIKDESWRDAAACRDHDAELFFPIGEGGLFTEQITIAKAVCGTCAVRAQCLERAMTGAESGVWGGTTERERRRLRRCAAARAKAVPA